MRHWTLRIIQRTKFEEAAYVPAPFPGRWPTRIAFECGNGVTYIGKPDRCQVQRLLGIRSGGRYSYKCWEFDTKHIVYYDQYGVGTYYNKLYDAYHPWQGYAPLGLAHFAVPLYLKNIGGFRCYSPTPILKRDYIEKYRAWMLQNTGKELVSKDELVARKATRAAERLARQRRAREIARVRDRQLVPEAEAVQVQPVPARDLWQPYAVPPRRYYQVDAYGNWVLVERDVVEPAPPNIAGDYEP